MYDVETTAGRGKVDRETKEYERNKMNIQRTVEKENQEDEKANREYTRQKDAIDKIRTEEDTVRNREIDNEIKEDVNTDRVYTRQKNAIDRKRTEVILFTRGMIR